VPEPFALLRAGERRSRFRGETQVKAQVALARRIAVAGFIQALVRVLAHGVEQVVALAAGIHDDERFLHELGQVIERARLAGRSCSGERFRRLERPAAGEHGKPLENRPLIVGQEVVAPVDQRA